MEMSFVLVYSCMIKGDRVRFRCRAIFRSKIYIFNGLCVSLISKTVLLTQGTEAFEPQHKPFFDKTTSEGNLELPERAFSATRAAVIFAIIVNPLDVVKNSLVQEYVEFLNAASKEELLELKGIGQKMAEYIIELRESSPKTSLNDLEKIGLSPKQVNNIFGRAAKGLFD